MIAPELQNKLEHLAGVLLPGSRPYWLCNQELPEDLRVPGVFGCFGRSLDAACAPYLESKGQWQGRAPAIVLDFEAMRRATDEPYSDELRVMQALAIGCHELAHVAELGIGDAPVTPVIRDHALAVLAYSAAVIQETAVCPDWQWHPPHWLRILVHSIHRAHEAGFAFPAHWSWTSPRDDSPPIEEAAWILDREVVALRSVPLTELRQFRPPQQWYRLWQHYVARWRANQPVNDPRADKVVHDALEDFERTT